MSRFRHSKDAANRTLDEFDRAFALLARSPAIGHPRDDLTKAPVLCRPVGSHLVVCPLDLRALQVVALRHGRDVKRLLAQRSRPAGKH